MSGLRAKISEAFKLLDLKDTSSENSSEKKSHIQPLAGATASHPGEDLPYTNGDDKEQNRNRIYRCRASMQSVVTGPSSFPFKFFDKILKGEVDLQHEPELPSFLTSNEEKKHQPELPSFLT